jgi:hypothetical protein
MINFPEYGAFNPDLSKFDKSVTTINLGNNNITTINWEGCRNEFIKSFYNDDYLKEYLEYKKSPNFIPYLPIVCKNKKKIS